MPLSGAVFRTDAKRLYGKEVTKSAAAMVVTMTDKAGRLCTKGNLGERSM